MAVVIPLLGQRQPIASPHLAFGLARRDMIRAYADWLRTNPPPDIVRLELEGTLATMDQLRQMEASHG